MLDTPEDLLELDERHSKIFLSIFHGKQSVPSGQKENLPLFNIRAALTSRMGNFLGPNGEARRRGEGGDDASILSMG